MLRNTEALSNARHLVSIGKTRLACEIYEQLLRDQPDNPLLKLEYANSLSACYRVAECVSLLDSLRSNGNATTEFSLELARSYASAYRPQTALDVLDCVPSNQRNVSYWTFLAVQANSLGDNFKALDAIAAATKLEPENPETNLLAARLLVQQKQHSLALDRLRYILRATTPEQQPNLYVRALYQYAQVLDQAEDFRNAFNALVTAKEIQKRHPAAEKLLKLSLRRVFELADLYKKLDEEKLEAWGCMPIEPFPDNVKPAHLIGFPRSGTTLLEQILDAHDRIATSSERLVFLHEILPEMVNAETSEITSWEKLDGISVTKLMQLRNRYWELMQATHEVPVNNITHIDKQPSNIEYLFGLIRLLPESQFLVMIRDPRDVVLSNFFRYTPDRATAVHFLSLGTTIATYGQSMEIWLYMREIMKTNSWTEVYYEKLCSDFQYHASRVLEFLGLEFNTSVIDYLETTRRKVINSPSASEVRQPIYDTSIGRWKRYAEFLYPYEQTLRPLLDQFGYA